MNGFITFVIILTVIYLFYYVIVAYLDITAAKRGEKTSTELIQVQEDSNLQDEEMEEPAQVSVLENGEISIDQSQGIAEENIPVLSFAIPSLTDADTNQGEDNIDSEVEEHETPEELLTGNEEGSSDDKQTSDDFGSDMKEQIHNTDSDNSETKDESTSTTKKILNTLNDKMIPSPLYILNEVNFEQFIEKLSDLSSDLERSIVQHAI